MYWIKWSSLTSDTTVHEYSVQCSWKRLLYGRGMDFVSLGLMWYVLTTVTRFNMKLISLIIMCPAFNDAVFMLPVVIMLLRSDQRELIDCAKPWVFLQTSVHIPVKNFYNCATQDPVLHQHLSKAAHSRYNECCLNRTSCTSSTSTFVLHIPFLLTVLCLFLTFW